MKWYSTSFQNILDLYLNLNADPDVPVKQEPRFQTVTSYYSRKGNYIPVRATRTFNLKWDESAPVWVAFRGGMIEIYQFFSESEGMPYVFAPVDDPLPDLMPSKKSRPKWFKLHYEIGAFHGSCQNYCDTDVDLREFRKYERGDIDPIFLIKAWCLYYNTYKPQADRPAGDKVDQFIKGLSNHYDISSLGKVFSDFANDYCLSFKDEDGTSTEATLDELASRLKVKASAKTSGGDA